MIQIGKIQELTVREETSSGFYLENSDKESVFLPGTLAPKDLKKGTLLKVFIYPDPQGRLMATTELPTAEVDQFAFLRVKDLTEFGYFLDWGITKDLLLPGNQKKEKLELGGKYLVRILLEEKTNRIYATQKIGPHFANDNIELHEKEQVLIMPYQQTPLGFKVLINEKYQGMIYHTEIFQDIFLGEKMAGFVKKIRPDNLIDISLNPLGMTAVRHNREFLLEALEHNGDFLPITTRSSPEEINKALGISKLAFKKAVTTLFKEGRLELGETGIKLVNKNK